MSPRQANWPLLGRRSKQSGNERKGPRALLLSLLRLAPIDGDLKLSLSLSLTLSSSLFLSHSLSYSPFVTPCAGGALPQSLSNRK
jgi:hypothetical protein